MSEPGRQEHPRTVALTSDEFVSTIGGVLMAAGNALQEERLGRVRVGLDVAFHPGLVAQINDPRTSLLLRGGDESGGEVSYVFGIDGSADRTLCQLHVQPGRSSHPELGADRPRKTALTIVRDTRTLVTFNTLSFEGAAAPGDVLSLEADMPSIESLAGYAANLLRLPNDKTDGSAEAPPSSERKETIGMTIGRLLTVGGDSIKRCHPDRSVHLSAGVNYPWLPRRRGPPGEPQHIRLDVAEKQGPQRAGFELKLTADAKLTAYTASRVLSDGSSIDECVEDSGSGWSYTRAVTLPDSLPVVEVLATPVSSDVMAAMAEQVRSFAVGEAGFDVP